MTASSSASIVRRAPSRRDRPSSSTLGMSCSEADGSTNRLISKSPDELCFAQMLREAFEVLLGIDRGHAAGSGCGDGLAIHVVLDVAAGEDAGDARARAGVR